MASDCAYVGQMHVYGLPGERRHFGALELASVSLHGALALAQAALQLRPDIIHVAKPQPINGLAGVLAARSGAAMYVDCDDYEAAANRFGGAWQRRVVAWWEDRLPRLARGVSVNTRFLYNRTATPGCAGTTPALRSERRRSRPSDDAGCASGCRTARRTWTDPSIRQWCISAPLAPWRMGCGCSLTHLRF
ncbi:MAG: glycosyltransferase [Roseiflexaceae bacterium]|nr:glycosyltransferase [Roseiflexaceae bacterium]